MKGLLVSDISRSDFFFHRDFSVHVLRVPPWEALRKLLRISAVTAMTAALHPTVPSSSCTPTLACSCARFHAARGLRNFSGVQGEDTSEQ